MGAMSQKMGSIGLMGRGTMCPGMMRGVARIHVITIVRVRALVPSFTESAHRCLTLWIQKWYDYPLIP